jgi:hypothetical protein
MSSETGEQQAHDPWGHFGQAHDDLVKARRAVREGRATEQEVLSCGLPLEGSGFELGILGEALSRFSSSTAGYASRPARGIYMYSSGKSTASG